MFALQPQKCSLNIRKNHQKTANSRVRRGQAARADLGGAMSTLRETCVKKSVSSDVVLENLQAVEAAHKATSQVQDFPQALDGNWRLVFAVPAPIPQWSYIPVIEDAVISVEKGTIALKSFLGPFEFTFGGRCSFKARPEQQQYDMDFSFSSSEIAVFGKKWISQREPKQKTYSFFLLKEGLAAVNSSATGGKTLMYKI